MTKTDTPVNVPLSDRRYYTISQTSTLVGVKPHILRYWEQEFVQLKPMKRRGRRYYQIHDIQLVHRIRELLYEQGYTIQGAKNQLIHFPMTGSIMDLKIQKLDFEQLRFALQSILDRLK